MVTLSLALNILVLLPVCYGLVTNAPWALASYGELTPARSILLSVYVTIGIISVVLLFVRDPKWLVTLLLVQVIYKFLTPLTFGGFDNPVVTSNILIAAFHVATLTVIWRTL